MNYLMAQALLPQEAVGVQTGDSSPTCDLQIPLPLRGLLALRI